jgi:putative intracellular protease/amidase
MDINGLWIGLCLPLQLAELGTYENSSIWDPCVVVDGNIITGQNPASAKGVGEAILKALS